ncbi:WhiB family transcriptional regulator [Blastococcus sp. VKM Ac-2987]|uniref:WhiB family transcriptional regulator n=1 Tax=Blastococcus sp. VKM Ac-2987 TaxID=3004141 RepID=UPI0022ABB891|nr:WhiB family transcriptional regulator [Blastococcus sp. VKM Ac-2987]MCZ2857440.1 WhiB family transcriptional regulator [Blastococcus sp. VKM Ac-2987]
MTIRAISERLAVSWEAARQWTHRPKTGFPAAIGYERNERLWLWADVREWAINQGRWDPLVDLPTRRVLTAAARRIKVDVITMPASDWQADGLCKEYPDVDFFPERVKDAQPAREVCDRCLVQKECKAFALADAATRGVWGGFSFPEERDAARETQ